MADVNNNLGFLGTDYQERLIKCLIEDKRFFTQLYHILDQNMFTDELHRKIVMTMKELYKKRNVVPSYYDIELVIKNGIKGSSQEWRKDQIVAVLDRIKNASPESMDLTESAADKFFKQQNLIKAINLSKDIIERGDYNDYYKIENYFRNALATNALKKYGRYNAFDEGWEHNLDDEARVTIPTGFSLLDKALRGGIAKTELGVIVAPAGTAKTSTTTGFVVHAAINGYKVLHIHIEDSPVQISRKEYAYLLNIEQQELSNPTVRPVAIEILKTKKVEEVELMKKNIASYNPSSFSCHDLELLLRELLAQGFKPDMVVLDYFEAMEMEKGEKTDTMWDRERLTMRRLEKLAKEEDLAIWVPVQGSKSSFNQEDYGAENAGGSVAKVQVCHILITLARTDQMRVHNLLNVHIKKFRNGAIKGDSYMNNVVFNNGTSRFSEQEDTTLQEQLDFESDSKMVAERIKKEYR